MAGISLKAKLQSFDQPQDILQRLADADTGPLMDEIGDYLISELLLNFENEETPEGEGWKPSQRAAEEGGKTLQDRGHLRDSYTYDAGQDSVEVGSNIIYAAIHHFGGDTGRNHATEIEARPALGLTEEYMTEIGEQVLDFYRDLVA